MERSLLDPSTELGSLMQHAIKIKGAQMEQDRRSFEKWPLYFQNTLWMKGPALELREKPLAQRLELAAKLKDAGNEHFKKKARPPPVQTLRTATEHADALPPSAPCRCFVLAGAQHYAAAIEQYEQALGSFRWAKQLDPGATWREAQGMMESVTCAPLTSLPTDVRQTGRTRASGTRPSSA